MGVLTELDARHACIRRSIQAIAGIMRQSDGLAFLTSKPAEMLTHSPATLTTRLRSDNWFRLIRKAASYDSNHVDEQQQARNTD
jgi:hypothetical protein